MSSYTSTNFTYTMWKIGNISLKKYKNDLKKELSKENYLSLNILNDKKSKEYQSEFDEIYNKWTEDNASDKLLTEIESKLHNYIIELKKELLTKYEKEYIEIKKELSEITIEESKIEVKINTKNDYKNLNSKLLEILEKIKYYDIDIYQKNMSDYKKLYQNNSYPQAKEAFLDTLKIINYNLKNSVTFTKIYKDNIINIYNEIEDSFLEESLKQEVNTLLKQKNIDKVKYEQIFSKLDKINQDYIKRKSIAINVFNNLKKIDYLDIDENNFIEELINNRQIEVPLKRNSEFKVLLTLENDTIFSRLIKLTDTHDITDSEKIEDKSVLSSWCKNLDNVVSEISKDFIIDYQIMEGEEVDVLYVLKDKKTRKEKNENQIREQSNSNRK